MVVELQYKRPVFARDICLTRVEPGRKLVEFYVELPNIPTAIAELFDALAKHNVLVSSISGHVTHNKLINFIIADFTYSNSSVDEVLGDLRSNEGVHPIRVEHYVPEVDGVITEKFGFPPVASSCRNSQELVVLRGRTFSSMLKSIRDLFGTGGDVIVLQQALRGGADTARHIEEIFSNSYVPPEFPFKLHLDLLTAFGFGIFELVDRDGRRVVVRVEESLESRYLDRCHEVSGCVFLKGYLRGAVEEHYKRRAHVEEVKCASRGDRFCEFAINFE